MSGKKIRWRMRHMGSSISHLPALPGLYAIVHDKKVLGLEAKRVYVYIGQTNNLRRRMSEHMPENESNPYLCKYLQKHLAQAKCWYTIDVEQELERKRLERFLIDELSPKFNRT